MRRFVAAVKVVGIVNRSTAPVVAGNDDPGAPAPALEIGGRDELPPPPHAAKTAHIAAAMIPRA